MKKFSMLFTLVMASLLLAASFLMTIPAFSQDATATPAPTITSVPPLSQKEGTIKLTFWYGLGGLLGNVVQETINQYNDSQDVYYIEAIFQSSYDDTINKLNAGLASGDLPNLVQVFEAGTQRMIDTGRIVPVQQLLERDGLTDVINSLEPSIAANYVVQGTLYSMPFNSSTAMLYIDRAAFREAGLDPDKVVWTFDEIAEAARLLTTKDDAGNTARYGIGLYAESWFFEQIHAVHNQLFGEPANGHQERMTAYSFNGSIGTQWFDWHKAMIDEGSAIWYGPGGSSAAAAAYTNGETAMYFSSIASLRTLIAGAERAGKGVEVGVIWMPRNPDADGKTIVGGASLWITNTGTPEQQEGAWDFIKWAIQPEIQAFWSVNTGYVPVVTTAYDLPAMQEAVAQYPQLQIAVDQLRSAEINDANAAHLSGTFVSMRQDVITAMDDFLTGKVATAQEALDRAVSNANEILEEYNSTVGQ
jgi:sn-glycerol 3-phosphate transport system substrate-binding protein